MTLPNLVIGVDPGFVPDFSRRIGGSRIESSIWRTARSLRHALCRCIPDGVRARLRDWAEDSVHRPEILDTDLKNELTERYFRYDIRRLEAMLDRNLAHRLPA